MGSPDNWQLTKQQVSERGLYLLESGQWSDCNFIVGQEPQREIVHGHKLFLAMSSPVFEAMFFGSMPEKNDPIPIPDVQPEAFKALLNFIYTDSMEFKSFEVAFELCYCAKKYMLPYLVTQCTEYIQSDLSPKRVCKVYEFAKFFEEPDLLEQCLTVMRSETDEILSDASWEQVEISTVSILFQQDILLVDTEIDLFDALLRWSRAECIRKSLSPSDPASLRSVIGDVIEKIRFLTLTPQQFANGPGKSDLLTKDEAFAILMNISSNGSGIEMPRGFSTEMRSRVKPNSESEDSSFDTNDQSTPTSEYRRKNNRYMDPNFPMFNLDTSLKRTDSPVRFMDEGSVRESSKRYCRRILNQSTICLNSNVLDCSVTFKVDKNICIIGVQVPTQIVHPSSRRSTSTYTEILYAYLLDSDGSRVTYTHFTTAANCDSTVEICFNRAVYIQKNKVYRIGVVFNRAGTYPIGECPKETSCHGVHFAFCVGRSIDSVRDGLIRAIIFT